MHPHWLSASDLEHMADDLADRGVQRWVLQRARSSHTQGEPDASVLLQSDSVSTELLAQLQQRVPHVVLR